MRSWLTIYQIQAGDHGPTRALHLLLVRIFVIPPSRARLIALAQCPRSTHEGRESAQEAQHPILARIPTIPHSRSANRQRRDGRGPSFRAQPSAEHALACDPGATHPVFRRPARLGSARRGDAQHPRRPTSVVDPRREGEGTQGRDVRQIAARAAAGRAPHRDYVLVVVPGCAEAIQADRV